VQSASNRVTGVSGPSFEDGEIVRFQGQCWTQAYAYFLAALLVGDADDEEDCVLA